MPPVQASGWWFCSALSCAFSAVLFALITAIIFSSSTSHRPNICVIVFVEGLDQGGGSQGEPLTYFPH